MTVAPDGSAVYVAGPTYRPGELGHFVVQALHPTTGAQLWRSVSTLGGTSVVAAVSADGARIFVAGHSGNDLSSRWEIAAFDTSTGEELWTARYHPPGGADLFGGLAVAPDGSRVYLSGEGSLKSWGLHSGALTGAYDAATGKLLWIDLVRELDTAYAIASSSRDRVYVAGAAQRGNGGVVAAYDGSTGKRLWLQRWRPPSGSIGASPAHLAVSADGRRVFMGGTASLLEPAREEWEPRSFEPKFWLQVGAIDARTGRNLWTTPYRRFPYSGIAGISVDPTGSRVFASGFQSRQGRRGAITVAYEGTTGSELWTRRFLVANSDIQPRAVEASADGDYVFVAGHTLFGKSGDDFLTLAYRARSGQPLWSARFNTSPEGTDTNHALSMSLAPGGSRIYVTGSNEQGRHPQILGYAT